MLYISPISSSACLISPSSCMVSWAWIAARTLFLLVSWTLWSLTTMTRSYKAPGQSITETGIGLVVWELTQVGNLRCAATNETWPRLKWWQCDRHQQSSQYQCGIYSIYIYCIWHSSRLRLWVTANVLAKFWRIIGFRKYFFVFTIAFLSLYSLWN